MPSWQLVSIGVAAGLAIVSAAVYIAVRPYLRHDFSKCSMPELSGRRDDLTGASNLQGCGLQPSEDA